MTKIQDAFKSDPNVELVSITVDPDDDTPAVLNTYANRYHADKDKWLFLTGKEEVIHKLINEGFRQVVDDNRGQTLQPGQYIFTHSTEMVLVDSHGIIRGNYPGTDQDGTLVYDLKGAVNQLERE
jgi:protein SCO1/2